MLANSGPGYALFFWACFKAFLHVFLGGLKALVLMVPLFRHNIFTKKGGSTSKNTIMDGPDTEKSTTFELFFIGLCAPADMVKIGKTQEKKGATNNGSINPFGTSGLTTTIFFY